VGGLTIGAIARAFIVTFTHIPHIWVTPLWLATTAGIGLFTFLSQKYLATHAPPQAAIQTASNALATSPSPVTFNATTHFAQAYTSTLTAEAEQNILIAATQNQPNDRESFLAKFIGIGLISYVHDITWAYIFRSQILLLMEINKPSYLSMAGAKVFYDAAVQEYSDIYKTYSFDQWLNFIKSHGLIVQHPSDMLEITWRGKDYLKYSTHWARYPDARKF
jgi:hypothetical protein